jgi:N-hydroxyarylamine O-acetyltransferase
MAEKINLNAYFERIGFAGSIAPTLTTLEMLHALHPAVIPFENLDVLAGLPVGLDQKSLERKLLTDKRGGYCFEHNLLFLRELGELDYVARPLLARSLWNRDPANATTADHLLVLVEINKQNYLADVGFGGLTLTTPLRLRADVEQSTPHETFRLSGGDPEWLLEVRLGEDWRAVYAFALDEIGMDQIEAAHQRILADREGGMAREIRVALSPTGRRLKLHDAVFTIQPVDGEADKRRIEGLGALKGLLIDEFGLILPPSPELEEALARIVPPAPDTDTE